MSDYPQPPINAAETEAVLHTEEWSVPSRISDEEVMKHTDRVEKILTNFGWDEETAYRFGYAVQELLNNAIVYGNLGLLETDENRDHYEKLIAEAEGKTENQRKTVRMKITVTGAKCVLEIEDQSGNKTKFWETQKVADPLAQENLLKVSGRGRLLTREFVSDFKYDIGTTGTLAILTLDK